VISITSSHLSAAVCGHHHVVESAGKRKVLR
jgi:hypothetical protein